MIYYCSLITPPSRFSSRVRVQAMDELHAFRYMQDKYANIINRFPDAIILVETNDSYTYFNWIGVDITDY